MPNRAWPSRAGLRRVARRDTAHLRHADPLHRVAPSLVQGEISLSEPEHKRPRERTPSDLNAIERVRVNIEIFQDKLPLHGCRGQGRVRMSAFIANS